MHFVVVLAYITGRLAQLPSFSSACMGPSHCQECVLSPANSRASSTVTQLLASCPRQRCRLPSRLRPDFVSSRKCLGPRSDGFSCIACCVNERWLTPELRAGAEAAAGPRSAAVGGRPPHAHGAAAAGTPVDTPAARAVPRPGTARVVRGLRRDAAHYLTSLPLTAVGRKRGLISTRTARTAGWFPVGGVSWWPHRSDVTGHSELAER